VSKLVFGVSIAVLLVGGSLGVWMNRGSVSAQENVSIPAAPLKEARDFATVHLGNAWDMSQFEDVSQYLNGAGRHPSLTNIEVKNGVFSARSTGDYTDELAFFFPLYFGYNGFMQIGNNLGSLHPIPSNEFRCIYIAMRVASPQFSDPWGPPPDQYRVFWHATRVNPYQDGPRGGTYVYLYPETTSYPWDTAVVHRWELHKLDLGNPPILYDGSTPWNQEALWRGLEINPTIYKDVDFMIDWVRLTSCTDSTEHQAQISWSPNLEIDSIWAKPKGTNREILLKTGIDGSSGTYLLDTKGLAPGNYKIGAGKLGADCSSQGTQCVWSETDLVINQTPTLEFLQPSPFSGQDYATFAGNSWDMDSSGDTPKISCAQASFLDGILSLDTQYPANLSGSCRGDGLGEADPKIYLNFIQEISSAGEYRYLSIKLFQNGAYAIPADGMIGRLIWTRGNNCTLVSADIPYDTGWHIYTIDLFDTFNGKPVGSAPSGCSLTAWKDSGKIINLRFDPNENYTGINVPPMVFHQELDWIRLTKTDQAIKGQPYPIRFTVNKPLSDLKSIALFYTDDLSEPLKHPVTLWQPDPPVIRSTMIYLPAVLLRPFLDLEGVVTNYWDTGPVPAGEYYLCGRPNDGLNAATFCSDAPVKIVSP